MSKTHSKENSLFNDIASTTIAGQLESRLRELERNIAVAHEFIKLADESYNQVKHEWELLQNDTPSTKRAPEFPSISTSSKSEDEDRFEDIPSFKEKKTHNSHGKTFKSFGSTDHTPSLGAKPEASKKKEASQPTETETSAPEKKEPQTPRPHKKGKGSHSKS